MQTKNKIILATTTVAALTSTPIATICSIAYYNGYPYKFIDFSTLPDYDWSTNEPYWTAPEVNISVPATSQSVNILNQGRVMDYSKISTGYHSPIDEKFSITKQAITGQPSQKAISTKGNTPPEYGFNDVNSYWNTIHDAYAPDTDDSDIKYNVVSQEIIPTQFTAKQWVPSQKKNTYLNMGYWNPRDIGAPHNILNLITDHQISNEEPSSFAYTSSVVDWATVANSVNGDINASAVSYYANAAHKNGSKYYGILVFVWYEYGGKRGVDFDKLYRTDANGNYMFADLLFNTAKRIGIDGWMVNEESNADSRYNTGVDATKMAKIYERFNYLASQDTTDITKQLKIINYSPIARHDNDFLNSGNELQEFMGSKMQFRDFNANPNHLKTFKDQYPTVDTLNIYNNPRGGEDWNAIGAIDARAYIYYHYDPDQSGYQFYTDSDKEIQDGLLGRWKFNPSEEPVASRWIFAPAPPMPHQHHINPTIDSDTYWLTSIVNKNVYMSTGKNTFLSPTDTGVDVVQPNDTTVLQSNNDVHSYGVGDTIWEKTPLFDGGLQHFKSNFSVGIGCKFVENDGTILENYPWHVPNLVDIYPTYTWDIQKYKSSYDVAEKLGGYKGTMIFMMHIVKEIH